jgi:hypothetical protein
MKGPSFDLSYFGLGSVRVRLGIGLG